MPVNNDPQLDYRHLYSAYRKAWTRFSAQVTKFESLSSQADKKVVMEEAKNCLEYVEFSYREHRNALAAFLLSNVAHSSDFPSTTMESLGFTGNFAYQQTNELQFAIRLQAHRFWEEGGRQEGQAAFDWSRAETYIQQQGRASERPVAEAAA